MLMPSIHRVVHAVAPLALLGCIKTIVDPGNSDRPAVSTIVSVAGNNQTGAAGQPLGISPVVRVLNVEGRPVNDITVVFAASSGGSVTDGVVRSDANGVASAGKWTLGAAPGQQSLTATVPGVASATFVATAVGGAPSPDRVLVDARPYGLAISPSGIVYTSQLDGRSVTRVQVGSTSASGVIAVGSTPTDVAFDPTGSLALVTNQFDPSVGIIDVATGRQSTVIPGSASMFRVLVAPDGQRAYATESDGKLLVINLNPRALVTTIPIDEASNGLAFAPGDTLLYVTSMRGTVAGVNLKTNKVVAAWNEGGTLQDIAVSPDGGALYVAHEDAGIIDVVNPGTGAVTTRLTTSAGVFGLKISPDGKILYATEPSAGQVVALDRATGRVLRTFSVSGIPRRIAFDRTTGRALISNEFGWLDFLPLP
jgi:DNA-binding beta-propeller fold protein YncE